MPSSLPVYYIDTCSLTAMRRVYPRSHFPHVWELIDRLAVSGRLVSVDEVFEELDAQDDEVADWARTHRSLFQPLSEDIQIEARGILREHPTLLDLKKRKSGADPFLIAAAKLGAGIVVTEERRSGGPPAMKIPDVCARLGVRCITLLELIQAET